MKTVSYLLAALVVLGLAFWAYHVNYATKDRLAELRSLNQEIADLQEGLNVLNAEWAYLNRPERLRELVNLNFASLQLLPLAPEQFGTAAQVAYPQPEEMAPNFAAMGLGAPIDVAARGQEDLQ
ncbi:cell division protein FtsL [Rhodobacter sp. TJ_12]|uniref:cell division protein FtsL n=1 Tax=Rhodobacter sp. TJ_12 TaxID=2029399 RepID=UPI001CC18E7F|nr:cell division protein FtsL [Rhodobacter sp. TJ_12]